MSAREVNRVHLYSLFMLFGSSELTLWQCIIAYRLQNCHSGQINIRSNGGYTTTTDHRLLEAVLRRAKRASLQCYDDVPTSAEMINDADDELFIDNSHQ